MILKGKYANAVIHTDNADGNVLTQIREFLDCDLAEGANVHIMPDTHAGKGCVVGFTCSIKDKVCPNLVGVDIGCQMTTIKLPKAVKISPEVFLKNAKKIPSGVGVTSGHAPKFVKLESIGLDDLTFDVRKLSNVYESIGSLGSGNHFIELNEDEEGNQYIVIHTGSRNLGQQVCGYHMNVAKNNVGRGELSYLTGSLAENYLHDMKICQRYACANHTEISNKLINFLGIRMRECETFTTMHNYINFNDHILRKGAISANEGEKVLIPFNMRDGSIIGIGKGNPEWNFSAPHGAGRIMSRGEAKRKITLEEFQNTMEGIVGTVCTETIDEAPQVYKNAKEIEELISDTVDVIHHLKVLANYKGF